MTVSELRKSLKGVPGHLEVYTRDHDHGEYETNGLVSTAKVIDQKKMDEWDKKNIDPIFHKKVKYFVVSV